MNSEVPVSEGQLSEMGVDPKDLVPSGAKSTPEVSQAKLEEAVKKEWQADVEILAQMVGKLREKEIYEGEFQLDNDRVLKYQSVLDKDGNVREKFVDKPVIIQENIRAAEYDDAREKSNEKMFGRDPIRLSEDTIITVNPDFGKAGKPHFIKERLVDDVSVEGLFEFHRFGSLDAKFVVGKFPVNIASETTWNFEIGWISSGREIFRPDEKNPRGLGVAETVPCIVVSSRGVDADFRNPGRLYLLDVLKAFENIDKQDQQAA